MFLKSSAFWSSTIFSCIVLCSFLYFCNFSKVYINNALRPFLSIYDFWLKSLREFFRSFLKFILLPFLSYYFDSSSKSSEVKLLEFGDLFLNLSFGIFKYLEEPLGDLSDSSDESKREFSSDSFKKTFSLNYYLTDFALWANFIELRVS